MKINQSQVPQTHLYKADRVNTAVVVIRRPMTVALVVIDGGISGDCNGGGGDRVSIDHQQQVGGAK